MKPSMSSPLVFSETLSSRCGKSIWLKRDDMFDPICKGPKGRRILKLINIAIKQNASEIITSGAIWSNQAEMLAQLSSQYGLQIHFLMKQLPDSAEHGSVFSDALRVRLKDLLGLGVNIIEIESNKWQFHGLVALKLQRKLERDAKKALIISQGATELTALGGSIDLAKELMVEACLLYTSPSPRDRTRSRMPSSA